MNNTVLAIAATTGFWLLFLSNQAMSHARDAMDSYRFGYAECKGGLESRYDQKAKP